MHSPNIIRPVTYKAITSFLLFILFSTISGAQQDREGITRQSGKIPVTHLRFNDDTGKLQFAIISDVWGGNRPGILEDAIGKLELLQPQFVMSVGDLIDGKTHDSILIGEQWREFNQKVNSLSMPFFYVPGNHDIGNADMEREWKKRFGKAYYHFIYKNVLFLCINTQDEGVSGVKDTQIKYFQKVIADNPNVRWTFLFMHRPVWQGENQKEEGYEKIEAALKGRNYTLFSGHHHTYLNLIKNGNKHFVLGSTGGGSDLRGEKFGEYDHVTLVTLKGTTSPDIVNLKLDGIIKEDVVNEKTFPVTQTLINEDWISAPPYVLPHQFEKSVSPEIIFTNPTPYPLTITGSMPQIPGCTITPASIDITLPANSKKKQLVSVTSADKNDIDLATLPFIDIQFEGSYQVDKVTYQLPAKRRLMLDWQHVLPEISNAKKISDDQFENFDSAGFISITNPELQNKWYWYGTTDCLIKFRLIRDSKYLYVTTFITDDQFVSGNNPDVVYIDFEDRNGIAVKFSITPGLKESFLTGKGDETLQTKDIKMKSRINASGLLRFVIQVPIDKIMKPDHSIRFNIGYRDQDNHPDIENSTLFWKPVWGSAGDYKNSGTYILDYKE